MRLGDAFFAAKTEYLNSDGGLDHSLYLFNNNSTRWNTLVTNFYGDPATIKYLP